MRYENVRALALKSWPLWSGKRLLDNSINAVTSREKWMFLYFLVLTCVPCESQTSWLPRSWKRIYYSVVHNSIQPPDFSGYHGNYKNFVPSLVWFFESAILIFFSNQSQFMGYQGWDKVFMISIISRKIRGGYRIMNNTVLHPNKRSALPVSSGLCNL